MNMESILLVKYGEIILRGKNRGLIENVLMKTIRKNLSQLNGYNITKEAGRFLVEREGDIDYDKIIPLVVNVFGVTAVCKAIKIKDKDINSIRENALEYMKLFYNDKNYTFKIETKRSDKSYFMDSREISADIGEYILNNMDNMKVNVKTPEITLKIEVRNYIYMSSEIIKGFGGLPIGPMGSTGKATLLLSGGIDSPVAGFLMAKRGVQIEAVYFDSPPYTSDRARQKVIDLAKRLAVFTGGVKLHIVPFTDVQLQIYEKMPREKMTIFLKRAMFKISEKIAIQNGSQGLVTGDSIGQVASQTMQAIDSINSAVERLPVFRPLCTMDKQEIIDIGRKIGTYDISIRPYEDCCTIFVAKHPQTKPKKFIIEKMERKLDEINYMLDEAVENTKIIDL